MGYILTLSNNRLHIWYKEIVTLRLPKPQACAQPNPRSHAVSYLSVPNQDDPPVPLDPATTFLTVVHTSL